MFCHKCGKKLHNEAQYCSFCGEAIINHTKEDNKIEMDNNTSTETEKKPASINYSNKNNETSDEPASIKDKIFKAISFIITLICFAIASVFGKAAAHDPSFQRILQYVIPGLLTGGSCAIIAIFINSRLYSNKVKYKWACVLICALVGALFGIYAAILSAVIFGLIMYFSSK